MCGITGFVKKSDLIKMTNSLPYRGLVLEGFYLTTKKVLGLVYKYYIVNLLDVANQPMTSHCGRFIMLSNFILQNQGFNRSKLISNKK